MNASILKKETIDRGIYCSIFLAVILTIGIVVQLELSVYILNILG